MFVYADRMNRQLWNFVELCSKAYQKVYISGFFQRRRASGIQIKICQN